MQTQKKKQNNQRRQNILESLKDIGSGTVDSFSKQLFNLEPQASKHSTDFAPGEDLSMSELFSGKSEENRRLKAQISLERVLANEDSKLKEERMGQLRVQLQVLITEVVKLSNSANSLAKEASIAAFQVPVNPGIYHINFFESLISFLQSFRKKIEEAVIWLGATNKRAEKKNYWSMYKKKGSSFLLSPDHYLQRSAG